MIKKKLVRIAIIDNNIFFILFMILNALFHQQFEDLRSKFWVDKSNELIKSMHDMA